MSSKFNKNQEYVANTIWQRNLSDARNININIEDILDNSFSLLRDLLNNYKSLNDTDEGGLLLSLYTCIGHFSGNSIVRITNHTSNLNIFLLLIGPSGSGKSKIISPIKRSIITMINSLGISEETAGIVDDFTTPSLSAKLAKSNVFVVTDEAEKPLLEMGFYSPLSEISASDRISGCKFYGNIPTSKDTMSYHLEISSHLSFLGATTGRLWHRLINYYAQGHQSDGFSERFLHYALPKKGELSINVSQSIDYDDTDDDVNEDQESISDNDYETERSNQIHQNLPSLSQILIVARLLGKREFILSRYGTKKFLNKVRQYQEMSQIHKPNDVNYGSRMGKAAEILSKLAAVSEIVRISLEILQDLQIQNQLHHDDTTLTFIKNATSCIENKYPSSKAILPIQSTSCRVAGNLVCSHLIKMLFALYNVEPVLSMEKITTIDSTSVHSTIVAIRQRVFQMSQLFFIKRDLTGSMGLLRHYPTDMVNNVLDELINYELVRQGPYINTTSRGIVHMKSYPSENTLNDPIKRNVINKLLSEVKMDLNGYMLILNNSIIKDKQVLTSNGIQMLLLPEHKLLYETLQRKYPNLNLNNTITINNTNAQTNTNNESVNNNEKINHPLSDTQVQPSISNNGNLYHANTPQASNILNQLSTESQTDYQLNEFYYLSTVNTENDISWKDSLNSDQLSISPVNSVTLINPSNTNNLSTTESNTIVYSNVNPILSKENTLKHVIGMNTIPSTINDNNLDNSEEISDSTAIIPLQTKHTTCNTTPISLTTSNIIDEVTSKTHIEHDYITKNQDQCHSITPSIDQSKTTDIHISNTNIQSIENTNSETTPSITKDNNTLRTRPVRQNKRKNRSKQSIKPKRNNKYQ